MSDTSVQTSPKSAADAVTPDAPTPRSKSRKGPVRRFVEGLASLKLTVVLLALSIVLVFCGTLAQIDHGIWAVVKMYFRSFYVWIPLQIFFPRTIHIEWRFFNHSFAGFPFPGGWTLGALLLTNLVAAHAIRFKITWKRSGIFLIHAGLIVLMMSELITGLFAVEGNMVIPTGEAANYILQNDNMELAVVSPLDDKHDDVTSIPASRLRKGGTFKYETLPFDVRVVKYMPNSSDPVPVQEGAENPATEGLGKSLAAVPLAEGVGVDSDQKVDTPSAYVELKRKGTDESLGVYLVSALMDAQTVTVDDKKHQISLRPHRDYKDYTLQLLEFKHDVYPGTNVPKNFSSRVRLLDPRYKEDRDVLIYMNQPLRYQGETFYQAGVLGRDQGTILQVVRNPGWVLPYIACTMVILGLLVHFGLSLFTYFRSKGIIALPLPRVVLFWRQR